MEAVGHNRLRARLTSLGILFGVASVIAMLAIGKGAEQEILEQMRLLGSNNVVITPIVEQKEEPARRREREEVKRFSPGCRTPTPKRSSGWCRTWTPPAPRSWSTPRSRAKGNRTVGKGGRRGHHVLPLTNLHSPGRLVQPLQVAHGLPVAIIGNGVRTRFFTTAHPIGQRLKVGEVWVTVVGVLADRRFSEETASPARDS
jgi:putative ABC transport system permease protein